MAAKGGVDALDAELGKRIKSLVNSRAFYDWETASDFARTIDLIRASIVNELGKLNPGTAVTRLWQLIDADDKIMEKVDDSSGLTSCSLPSDLSCSVPASIS